MNRFLYTLLPLILFFSVAIDVNAERLNFYGRDAATIGVYISEISTGQVIEKENIGVAMIPASILKSVTSATALYSLKEAFKYSTDVVLQGEIQGDTLCGNLLVKASGDPTIESSHFAERPGFESSIVRALKSKGISNITGEIIVDEELFTDIGQCPQWVIEDVGWDYGAGYYGFNYKNNTFKLYTDGQKSIPEVPYIDVVVEKTTTSTDIIRGVNSDIYFISGKNVDNKNFSVTTTMNSPSIVFVHNLQQRLLNSGITVDNNTIESSYGETLLLRYESPANAEMLQKMMFHSDNMMAEALLRAIAPGGSRDDAIKKELNFWKERGISVNFLKIADGSGLARVNRVTPRFIADVLTYMAKSKFRDTYVSLFPKVGQEGTVKNILKNTKLEGKLVLKSGSMNGVHCYAGYKIDNNGAPSHVVVLMVNNFFCSRNVLRNEIQRFLLSIF